MTVPSTYNWIRVDFALQSSLLFIAILLVAAGQQYFAFIVFYFVLGAYQFISHYIKYFSGYRSRLRIIYNRCLFAIFVGSTLWVCTALLAEKSILYYLYIMLVVGFIMAVFSLIVSVNEQKRDL